MGTTWLFNVLRSMAEEAGERLGVVADGVDLPPAAWAGPVIIKSHRADDPTLLSTFDSKLDLHALVMMRDPEPTLASLLRTQTADLSELIAWLEADVASYESALPALRSAVVIREEWVADQAPEIIGAASELLNLGLSPEQIARVAAAYDRDAVRQQVAALEEKQSWEGKFTDYDRQTQWHAGHIGPDGPRTVELTSADAERVVALRTAIDALTERFSLWSEERGAARGASMNSGRAMDFVAARQAAWAAAAPPSGLRGLLARLKSGRT
jgi:hypothetical protein